MDYFDSIMQGIHEDVPDTTTEGAGIIAATAVAKGATAIAGSVASTKVINSVKFHFDADIKKDIQRMVKLEMKLKKYADKHAIIDEEVLDDIKEDIKDLNKRINKYKKGLSSKDTKESVDAYINKCTVDYGPTSLYYASIKVPKTKEESLEILDDGDLFTEKKNDDSKEDSVSDEENDTPEDETDVEDAPKADDSSEGSSNIKKELIDRIEKAFADADYKISITKKDKEAFLHNKKAFMTSANSLCLVLGKTDYDEKKKIIDDIVKDYKDDFSTNEDNHFTYFVNVKPKSSLYDKEVKESVYELITDDIDTFIESTDIFDDDIYEGISVSESVPEDTGNTDGNATPDDANKDPNTEEFSVGAMLPQCGSTDGVGDPNTVVNDVESFNKSHKNDSLEGITLPDDIEIESAIQEYIDNIDLKYDWVVENAVTKLTNGIKSKVKLSSDKMKAATDKAIAKARYQKAKLTKAPQAKLNLLKSNYVEAEKRLRAMRKGLSQEDLNALDEICNQMDDKYGADNVQESTRSESLEVYKSSGIAKKCRKACELYEKTNPGLVPFNKLTEKVGMKTLGTNSIDINPSAHKYKNKSKVYSYYDEDRCVLQIYKDIDIDKSTKITPSFSLATGFDVAFSYSRTKRTYIGYSAETTEIMNHIEYYIASWMGREKMVSQDIKNWADSVIQGCKKLVKEGFELIDERDAAVQMLERAMNNNDLDAITLYENKIKYIDTREERLGLVVTLEKANIDPEIKPVIEELNRKGYKTKYSSAGHTKLRKKEDEGRDGVYYGKLYSDARIMFDGDFDFPKAPKHWVWKTVDGKDYLDIIPQTYNSKDGTPDEAFARWKANYMGTLRTWVENLPERETSEDKVVAKDTKGRDKVNE